MCYDPPMLHTEEDDESQLMSPGHYSPASNRPVLVDGQWTGPSDSNPQDMLGSTSANTITIKLNTVSGFSNSQRILIHSGLNGTGSYEIFQIASSNGVNSTNKTITVNRAQSNNFPDPNVATTKIVHPVGAEIWINRTVCADAVRSTTPPYGANPFDGTIAAAEYFTTLFNASYDKIGVSRYSTNTTSVSALSSNLSAVKSSIHNFAAPAGSTNIAGGLASGRLILDGTGKRANAVRVMVLLTDGIANQVCGSTTYNTGSYNAIPCGSTNSGTTTQAQNHAYSEATRAKNGDILIFTIGLGDGVDANFLKRIADGGVNGTGPCQQNQPGCRYYFAPSPAQLDDAFQAIAEQTHIALVK